MGIGNIEQAVRECHPFGIDISSGVETDGVKDEAKIRQIIACVRDIDVTRRERKIMKQGRFGPYGGQYIPETLMNAILELEKAYDYYKADPQFPARTH